MVEAGDGEHEAADCFAGNTHIGAMPGLPRKRYDAVKEPREGSAHAERSLSHWRSPTMNVDPARVEFAFTSIGLTTRTYSIRHRRPFHPAHG